MKKSTFITISSKKFFVNFVIVFMLAVVSSLAVFGVGLVSSSNTVNGVYYSGNENSNKVSLMINVYWGTEYLDQMLEVLDKYNVKTTFFVGGTWAVKESQMLAKIYEAGHEIGNHGYYHKDQGKLSAEKNYEEIVNTHKLVKNLIGVDMNLFAPPSGSYNAKTVQMASELGYKTIMWTEGRDTIDWRDKDSELIYKRATKNCSGGDFVLMHPTKTTANALEKIVITLQEQGFELCTVSENLMQI
ncbi:MAG: polysaccharide deacetylase family protein [Clostridia bacterium]|nr:polysaccharide deacetylase family protein [Clostridia bacterium]